MASSSQAPNGLRHLKRYVTTHDAEGKAVLSKVLEPAVPAQEVLNGGITFQLVYTNKQHPSFTESKDVEGYQRYLKDPPALVIPGGTVCRFCDFAPGHLSPMHRTQSLDFGVVVEGEMELVLDSGAVQHLYQGDTVVQRGTNHAWRNVTPSKEVDGKCIPQWARMMFVLQAADPVTLQSGERLAEDEGGIDSRVSRGHR